MIPDDVAFQILLWLPVTSLLRFRSVCKSWLSHIDSSGFISEHARLGKDYKLIYTYDHFNHLSTNFSFTFSFNSVSDHQLSEEVKFSPAEEDQYAYESYGESLIASFNGLVCLTHKTRVLQGNGKYLRADVVSLWNPATKDIAILPPQYDIEYSDITEFGFGLDVEANDYKVVRVVMIYFMSEDSEFVGSHVVEVYSLNTDSWRVVDSVVPFTFCKMFNPKRPFRNEIYCWLGFDWFSKDFTILSFDFSNDAFAIISLPEIYTGDEYRPRLRMCYLREKIALTDTVCYSDCLKLIVWVLDEYGAKESSWTKLYTITQGREGALTGLPMELEGKLLVFLECRVFYLYDDPLTQEGISVLSSNVALYRESLISVRSANGVTKKVFTEKSEYPEM